MFSFLFCKDPRQRLMMFRHFAGILASAIFSIVSILFLHYDLYDVDAATFYSLLIFFWSGVLFFTLLIRTGLNKNFDDPSLTIPQILWGTTFILTVTYLLNESRSLMLMAYFGVLTFGYFKLKFREFLSIALFAILGYTLIILYIFINEADRIEIELELLQLTVFTSTVAVMLYTGSAIHQLRERSKKQHFELQEVLEINKTLAITDELTGLYNRRYFMDQLVQQKALSERDDSDFIVCFCDLDHFKAINDKFGHHTGDVVLKKFAEILKSSIREVDYAARFGGEEFVCLLVNTDIKSALKVTERIRSGLAKYNFNDIAPTLQATVSIGVSNFKQFHTIQETLMNADNRMYRAKELGRNKVVYSDDNDEAA